MSGDERKLVPSLIWKQLELASDCEVRSARVDQVASIPLGLFKLALLTISKIISHLWRETEWSGAVM